MNVISHYFTEFDTGAVNRLTGSGRPRSATLKNVDLVNDLVLSQENTPQAYKTVLEI